MKFSFSFSESLQATVCLVISFCITLATAQFFGFNSEHNALSGNFGGPTAFDGIGLNAVIHDRIEVSDELFH